MRKKIKNDFLTGIVVILPVVLTVLIFTFLVRLINENVLSPMIAFLLVDSHHPYVIYIAKALAFLIAILLVVLTGAATRLLILRNFFGFWERVLLKIPPVGKTYVAIKQISRAFLKQGEDVFKEVVLVEYPRKGIYSIGFVTGKSCREIEEKIKSDVAHVFLPTTPNPTTGFFLVIPRKEVIPLTMSVADGFKLIISGGAFSPN